MKYRIASLALALAVVVPPSATLVQAAPPGSSRLEVQQSFRQLMETRACPSCDLAGADLTRTDLKGVNLEGANLAPGTGDAKAPAAGGPDLAYMRGHACCLPPRPGPERPAWAG